MKSAWHWLLHGDWPTLEMWIGLWLVAVVLCITALVLA